MDLPDPDDHPDLTGPDGDEGDAVMAPRPEHKHETYQRSPTIGALFGALAKAQGEITAAKKSRVNPAFKSKYATLADCFEACMVALSKAEICVSQPARTQLHAEVVQVTTVLGHSSGEWMECTINMPLAKVDAHGAGSAMTYARRYGLCAMVGVAPDDDDDDGNASTGRGADGRREQPESPRQSQQPRAEVPRGLSSAGKDRIDAAMKQYAAARRAAGMKKLSAAEILIELKGPDFRLNTDAAAEDFASVALFEIEAIRVTQTLPPRDAGSKASMHHEMTGDAGDAGDAYEDQDR